MRCTTSFLAARRAARAAMVAGLTAGLTVGGATAATATPAPAAASATAAHHNARTVSIPVSFRVRNVNRSEVACPSDGKTYTVRGRLVAPAGYLKAGRTPDAVTLYLHGLSFGEFFWRFGAADYNYARNQARAGQASVIIDRLGYGKSDKPVGTGICVGSRADIAHQMVQKLRRGQYHSTRADSPAFRHVVLAGHSYGGQIAQVEAYSFRDIDGLIVIAYTDVDQSALLMKNAAYTAKVCAAGGLRVTPNGPGHYAPFGPPSKAAAALFHDVDPGIRRKALPKLSLDPCGDTAYFAKATRVDLKKVDRIHVPVLVISGGADRLFPPAGLPRQARLYTGTDDVSVVVVPNTGHAITLERSHHRFERAMARWLRHHT